MLYQGGSAFSLHENRKLWLISSLLTSRLWSTNWGANNFTLSIEDTNVEQKEKSHWKLPNTVHFCRDRNTHSLFESFGLTNSYTKVR